MPPIDDEARAAIQRLFLAELQRHDEIAPEQDDPPADADQSARDRELLDYLIEQTWNAYLQELRARRER